MSEERDQRKAARDRESDEDIRAYEELHVDMMMSKPFDFEEIQSAVAILTKGASVAVAA